MPASIVPQTLSFATLVDEPEPLVQETGIRVGYGDDIGLDCVHKGLIFGNIFDGAVRQTSGAEQIIHVDLDRLL